MTSYRNPLYSAVDSIAQSLMGNPGEALRGEALGAQARQSHAAAALDEGIFGGRTAARDAVLRGGAYGDVNRATVANALLDPNGLGKAVPDLMSSLIGGMRANGDPISDAILSDVLTANGTQKEGDTIRGQERDQATAIQRALISRSGRGGGGGGGVAAPAFRPTAGDRGRLASAVRTVLKGNGIDPDPMLEAEAMSRVEAMMASTPGMQFGAAMEAVLGELRMEPGDQNDDWTSFGDWFSGPDPAKPTFDPPAPPPPADPPPPPPADDDPVVGALTGPPLRLEVTEGAADLGAAAAGVGQPVAAPPVRIPPGAVAMLLKNPALAADFNAKYGAGTAEAVLSK